MAAASGSVAYRFAAIGKVQGVWFRKNTAKKGTALGLRGYVQNEDDRRKVRITWAPELAAAASLQLTLSCSRSL